MSNRNLIPKDKHDLDSVRRLTQHSAEDIEEIFPILFEWLQDINWPVAQELSKVLPRYGNHLVPHIEAALKSGDTQWQYSLLQFLIRELPKETCNLLLETIQRIAYHPTKGEVLEELDILAMNTIKIIQQR
ncbi:MULTISPECIES: DUF5071 domain-containing protein [Paenibacillus]|uniref:DUF5071 domain-containing protein n=1 Tax=Paenibacillus TaxID=44249 RepID=UPI0022B904BE|nr:DUF5071 domain-containing protein [Paenibacillus caseinilyticus]MCZ8522252.1 DUF5071 domain-containing protein [Paenibacillus caseinilyticus]